MLGMTEGQKTTLTLSLCGVAEGTPEAKLVEGYLAAARDAILAARNPFAPDYALVGWEERYDHLQCEVAAALYGRRGAEGEISHSENGVSHTWGTTGIPTHLMQRVVPRAGVPGSCGA